MFNIRTKGARVIPSLGSPVSVVEFHRGYMGIMENNMETTIIENQMEKSMEHEMETRED